MKEIFEKQKEFQKLVGNDITTQEFKNTMFLGLFEEVAELMKETPFKKHKKHQTFNRDNFLEECADAQLYLINLVLSEANSKEFLEIVKAKITKNFKRQKNDY